MPTIPKLPVSLPNPQKTISQIIENQFPDFVKEGDPTFIAFLKAYYEWMEKNGEEAYACKILGSTISTVTLNPIPFTSTNIAPSVLSTEINAYQGMHVVCTNGPTKGYTRKILSYDPVTFVVQIDPWDSSYIPPPNTRISIRDALFPSTLLEYRDIDQTIDRFINYFRDDFMYQIPGNILADKRNILKHIKDFYQARGTENSFRFLFRILFNEEIEIYYPKVDLFRASDAVWYVQKVMKTTTLTNTFGYVNRQLIGVYSGATASVESATQQTVSGGTVTELSLSSINGAFQIDPNTNLPEQVKIVYPVNVPPQSDLGAITDLAEPSTNTEWEQAYQLLQELAISQPGQNYQVGETITISGGSALSSATAVITSVFQTVFIGGCQPPPTTFYLEPYFGPDDTVNTNPDPTTDGVCIPGLYFFSDVHSDLTSADLLNSTEILLSANESSVDNFFVGDEIDLIGGTGTGQRRTIVSYNGTTKVATVNQSWNIIPDATTQYSITHVKGGIKSVAIVDFGLGFLTNPTVTINTVEGTGAVLPPTLGIVGTTAGMWLPGRDGGIGNAPTTTDSFASSNKIIQDSFYWQDFSYDIRVAETIDKYRDVVKALLHPAGFKMFGTVVSVTKPETNFLETVRVLTLLIGTKFFDLALKTSNTTTIQFNTLTPQVIGARNEDLDAMKFYAFPPNYSFNQRYSFPNQNYWSTGGPGNTQIQNFRNVVIGTIINYPARRTKVNADTYVSITNGNSITEVGPIGQSLATIALFRFTGFPPVEGVDIVYPAPNAGYWSNGYGNTQLSVFQNLIVGDVINNSRNIYSNLCVDSALAITNNQQPIPTIGNQVIYSFLEGINPQIVYNVSPNYDTGQYDAALGTSILTDSNDGTFVEQGVNLDSSNSEIVNASSVPISLKRCTVIVIANANGISDNTTLVGMIPNVLDNGFAIDLRTGGAISFRARYNGIEKTVDFPPTTVGDGDYFMAALRFNEGRLSGNVETVQTPQTTDTRSAQFITYPADPTTTSAGWYFGSPSTDFVPIAESSALFKSATFGSTKYGQAAVSSTPITMGYFNGNLCYALFYDRALYDYELDTIYNQLNVLLFNERGVNLNAGTLYQTQQGNASIRRTELQTLAGGGYIKLTRLKTELGVSRIQRTSLKIQSGISRFEITSSRTLSGISSLKRTSTHTLSGLSRTQKTNPKTQSGTTTIRNTTLRLQIGNAAIKNTTTKTLTGATRLLVSNVGHSIIGSADIYKTNFQTIAGIARMEQPDQRTMTGVARIRNTSTKTQSAVSRITVHTLHTESGVARIQITTTQTFAGISNVRATTDQTQIGVTRITVHTSQTISGVSTIS